MLSSITFDIIVAPQRLTRKQQFSPASIMHAVVSRSASKAHTQATSPHNYVHLAHTHSIVLYPSVLSLCHIPLPETSILVPGSYASFPLYLQRMKSIYASIFPYLVTLTQFLSYLSLSVPIYLPETNNFRTSHLQLLLLNHIRSSKQSASKEHIKQCLHIIKST